MNETNVDAFLEHHGVRGMKWGIRNRSNQKPQQSNDRIHRIIGAGAKNKAPRGDFKSRSKKQKAALVGGGVATWVVTDRFLSKILGNKAPIAQLGVKSVSTVAGVRATRHILDKNKSKHISELR